jgi:hypothetical protein
MEPVKIYFAYQWNQKDKDSEKKNTQENKNAHRYKYVTNLIASVKARVNSELKRNGIKEPCKIHLSRLRATSGSFLLSSIRERMKSAYAIIFDITEKNPNVMLELGMCLEMQVHLAKHAKVFLICESESFNAELLPSDLSGYYLTCYHLNKSKKEYKSDNLSLEMRITSDIINLLQLDYIEPYENI